MMWIAILCVLLLLLIGKLSELCYNRGVRDTEARWSEASTRMEAVWKDRIARYQDEIIELNRALAPHGIELMKRVPEGKGSIILPRLDYLAAKAAILSGDWMGSPLNRNDEFRYTTFSWRGRPLLQDPKH